MYEVQKRDGTIAEFDIAKISAAIAKAFDALEKQYHPSTIDLLALNVTAHFEPRIKDGVITVEDVQDSVEEVLSTAGYADVEKAYILYRMDKEKTRGLMEWKDGLLSREGTQRGRHAARLQGPRRPVRQGGGLAREGELHGHVLRGRADTLKLRCHHGQLLAFGNLRR